MGERRGSAGCGDVRERNGLKKGRGSGAIGVNPMAGETARRGQGRSVPNRADPFFFKDLWVELGSAGRPYLRFSREIRL